MTSIDGFQCHCRLQYSGRHCEQEVIVKTPGKRFGQHLYYVSEMHLMVALQFIVSSSSHGIGSSKTEINQMSEKVTVMQFGVSEWENLSPYWMLKNRRR